MLDENPEEMRQKLIDAAQELFLSTGYQETTIRMISSKAGIDSRSFSYLFASKEELLEQVVKQVSEEEIAEMGRIASGRQGAVQMLAAVFHSMFSLRKSRGLMIGLVNKRSVVIDHMLWENLMSKAGPLARQLIQNGIDAGEMHAVEPAQTAKLFINSMFYAYNCCAQLDEAEKQQMLHALIRMTETSLGIEPGRLSQSIAALPPLTA